MVTGVEPEPSAIVVSITLASPGCPLKHQIIQDVTAQVEALGDPRTVRVTFEDMTAEQRASVMSTTRKVAQDRAPMTMIPSRTRVIAVASGKGGVGKSSITANLAASFRSRASGLAFSMPTFGDSRFLRCLE